MVAIVLWWSERLSKIFGIVSITRAGVVEKNLEKIQEGALEYCRYALSDGVKFKVESKRSDKAFPLNSVELSIEVGGFLHENCPGLIVDVHNPDVIVKVEVRDFAAYVYSSDKKIKGQGGMPIGTGSKATLLLSGGIDSPVAGYMIAKRGVELNAVHFYSYPYTSERAKEKVLDFLEVIISRGEELSISKEEIEVLKEAQKALEEDEVVVEEVEEEEGEVVILKVEDTDEVYENMPTHETLFNGMFRKDRLLDIIQKYQIEIIAIGNGTASKESEIFIAELIKEIKQFECCVIGTCNIDSHICNAT